MRGKRGGKDSDCIKIRITPADAGKTPRWMITRKSVTDHPRGCGENLS